MKKPELLAPAGNLEKLKLAILYGADAVYCGGYNYGLREGADNFTLEELKKAAKFVRDNNSKIYITVNMIPHNDDLIGIEEYLHQLEDIGVDALIISDPGILTILQQEGIKIPVHLSTQANAVNWASISFWQGQGVERIILARELSKDEIMEIRDKSSISLEMFIHGAMCISYSGRCLLSNYMADRDANRGRCAHSCRWRYYLMEEQRPGEYYPIYEDESGTHIMNSKDLCLINEIPDIIETGIDSLKIEGRMKSLHYVSTVTSVYRKALDTYLHDPKNYVFKKEWLAELKKVSHRGYTTGFFHGKPAAGDHNYYSSAYQRNYDFMGVVRQYLPKESEAVIEVRHKFFKGDFVEIMGPRVKSFLNKIDYIISEDGEMVNEAPHPKELIRIPVNRPVKPYYILRREKEDE